MRILNAITSLPNASARKKASRALTVVRANMVAALARAMREEGLEDDEAEDFLQQQYGNKLEEVAEDEGVDVEDLVESMWEEIQS